MSGGPSKSCGGWISVDPPVDAHLPMENHPFTDVFQGFPKVSDSPFLGEHLAES